MDPSITSTFSRLTTTIVSMTSRATNIDTLSDSLLPMDEADAASSSSSPRNIRCSVANTLNTRTSRTIRSSRLTRLPTRAVVEAAPRFEPNSNQEMSIRIDTVPMKSMASISLFFFLRHVTLISSSMENAAMRAISV